MKSTGSKRLTLRIKDIIKSVLAYTPFYPFHMGSYTRWLYFKKYFHKMPLRDMVKILDAGCGSGIYAVRLARQFPHITVHGIDINGPSVELPALPNFSFTQGDLKDLQATEIYDLIYCIDVLEHISGNILAIQNFHKALRRKGILFIHVPYEKNQKRILPSKFFKQFDDWRKHEHTGEQYTLNEWESILKGNKFEILNAEHTFGFLGELVWEIDRVTDRYMILKVILQPILRILAHLTTYIKHKKGHILILGMKK